jgi:hypothetical protein
VSDAEIELRCPRCAKLFGTQPAFQFQTPGGPIHRCLRCCLVYIPMLRRSSAVAAIVGTILVGINQGDAMFYGLWPASLLWKVPLTYAVPFAVASVGALLSSRIQSSGT